MDPLQNFKFDSHSMVIEFFRDLKMPKELAVEFYAELEAFISAYVSKLIFAAHTDAEMVQFRSFIKRKNINDDVKIATMLRISFEKKTGQSVDELISDILKNLAKDLGKISAVIDNYSKGNSLDLDLIFKEMVKIND